MSFQDCVREVLGDGFTCEDPRIRGRRTGPGVLSIEGELAGERIHVSAWEDEHWSPQYGTTRGTWTLILFSDNCPSDDDGPLWAPRQPWVCGEFTRALRRVVEKYRARRQRA